MPFVKRHRDYYKYGTEPNATIVGSFARIDEGIASGFSASNYLTLSEVFNPQSNTWEQVWSVTTGANTSTTYQRILAQTNVGTAAVSGYDLRVDSGKIVLYVEGTAFTGATVLQDNTHYLIKAQYTGSAYILSYSTDNGESWVEDCNVASTVTGVPDMNVPQYVGIWKSTYNGAPSEQWLGTIDLTQSYININGERWWSGDSYTKVGSWIDDGVVSGFTTSNYLTFDIGSHSTSDLIEVIIPFNTGTWSDTSAKACNVMAGSAFPAVQIYNQKANLAGNGTYGTYTYSTNEDVVWKIQIQNGTGNIYRLDISTNEFVLDYTFSYSTAISGTVNLGYQTSNRYLANGSIDLNSSYIKINDKMWWHGTKAVETTKEDADYHVDRNKLYDLIVRGNRTWFKQAEKQSATGTYTFTLEREYIGKMLFVGNGGGGSSSQRSSVWYYTGGGSGAVFEGKVKLPADTYTLTIGTLGYSYNIDNVAGHSKGVQSTDSFLTNSTGEELIRVGAGAMGTGTSSGGAGGTLTLGTIEVLETTLATDGNKGGSGSASVNYALSAYDGTTTGYGAGTGSERYQGNVYGIAGIFDLVLEADINNYDWYEDDGTKTYDIYAPRFEWISQTFLASDALQTYIVPDGVAEVQVSCVAAAGYSHTGIPGYGGKVRCNLAVTAGQTLYIAVGKQPTSNSVTYNASDVRTDNTGVLDETSLQSRIIVAGGGGGQGSNSWAYDTFGGAGGGLTGAQGDSTYHSGTGGYGGTQTAGGSGGGGRSYTGASGTFGLGGRGGNGTAGAGGAGWYGGGGGGYSGYDSKHWVAGGGGGSSYTDPSLCSNVAHSQGVNNGDGYVTIRYKRFLMGGVLTINTLPENTTITINGYKTNSLQVEKGSIAEWQVSLDGWTSQSGKTIVNANKEITVDLMKEFPAEPTYTVLLHAAGASASQEMIVEEEGWYRFHYYNTYGASDRYGYASIDGVTKYSWRSSQNSYTTPEYLEAGQVVRVWNNGVGYTLNTYFEKIT